MSETPFEDLTGDDLEYAEEYTESMYDTVRQVIALGLCPSHTRESALDTLQRSVVMLSNLVGAVAGGMELTNQDIHMLNVNQLVIHTMVDLLQSSALWESEELHGQVDFLMKHPVNLKRSRVMVESDG